MRVREYELNPENIVFDRSPGALSLPPLHTILPKLVDNSSSTLLGEKVRECLNMTQLASRKRRRGGACSSPAHPDYLSKEQI